MNHAMVDVEALRLKQPWRAPLMSVGVVVFDEWANIQAKAELFVIPGSLPAWAEPEASTVEFWIGQEYYAELKRKALVYGMPTLDILQWMKSFWLEWKIEATWFAGPTYDQVMLEAYFDHYHLENPWKYNDTRDFRTIRKQHPEISKPIYEDRQGTHHSALDDCLHQLRTLKAISDETGRGWQ